MNADQKKRIAHEISNWKNACNCRAVQLAGDRMAAMLQELADGYDAPDVLPATNPSQISSFTEPVEWLPGGFRIEHFTKDDPMLTDEANAERRFFVTRIESPYPKDGVWFGATAGAALAKACAALGIEYADALAGVSTEHLEQYGLPDFAQKISDLAQQRDKLLAALEKCRDMVGHPDYVDFINAAIAGVKGQS